MAKIDIAIPCFQYGHFLGQCLDSVLNQASADLRVVVIDNASTDNSVEVAQEFARNDARVEVIAHPKNLGPHASYNEALDWARSDYFLLLDADDFLHDGALERAVTFLDSHGDVGMTYGRASYLTPDGVIHPGNQVDPHVDWEIVGGDALIREFCARPVHMIPSPTVIRRTTMQKKAGYYRTTLQYTDDMEMWLRLSSLGRVARTGHPQAVQRMHPTRHTNQFLESLVGDFTEREKAIRSFFEREGASMSDADEMLALARRSLGCHAYWAGLSQMLKGNLNPAKCRAIFGFAFSRCPSAIVAPPFLWLYKHKLPHRRTHVGPQGALQE